MIQRVYNFSPAVRLQHKYGSHKHYRPVAPRGGRDKDKTTHGVKQQDVAIVEQSVQLRKSHKQKKSPGKAGTKITTPATCIAHLNIEAESEKQRKGGISLTGKQKKQTVRHPHIQFRQPSGLKQVAVKNIIVFQIM